MEKTTLQSLVDAGMNQVQIAREVGLSQPTVRKWLLRHGFLKSKITYSCKCGASHVSEFVRGNQYECRSCSNGRKRCSLSRKIRLKKQMVEYKGGCCQHLKPNGEKCGYKSCLAALDFHHLDPSAKDPNCKRMWRWGVARIKAELDKCVLVCKNCHMEMHHGLVA